MPANGPESSSLFPEADAGPVLRFQRLDVYRLAVHFAVLCDGIQKGTPTGRAYLADQLRRAALSVVNNIAEGAGEFSAADKARFYRMALRSTTECAASVDVARALELVQAAKADEALHIAVRIVTMLTRLIERMRERPRT